ncbi:hypothetical protein OTU49_004315, partial [Cherax quadricarinatus]
CQAAEEPLWKRVLELVTSQRPAVLKVMKLCSVPCRSLLLPLLLLLIHPAKASSVFRKLRQQHHDSVSATSDRNSPFWNSLGPNTGEWYTGDGITENPNTGNWYNVEWYTRDPGTGGGITEDPDNGNGNPGGWHTGDPSTGGVIMVAPDTGDGIIEDPDTGDWYSGNSNTGDGITEDPNTGSGYPIDWYTSDPINGDGTYEGPSTRDSNTGDDEPYFDTKFFIVRNKTTCIFFWCIYINVG